MGCGGDLVPFGENPREYNQCGFTTFEKVRMIFYFAITLFLIVLGPYLTFKKNNQKGLKVYHLLIGVVVFMALAFLSNLVNLHYWTSAEIHPSDDRVFKLGEKIMVNGTTINLLPITVENRNMEITFYFNGQEIVQAGGMTFARPWRGDSFGRSFYLTNQASALPENSIGDLIVSPGKNTLTVKRGLRTIDLTFIVDEESYFEEFIPCDQFPDEHRREQCMIEMVAKSKDARECLQISAGHNRFKCFEYSNNCNDLNDRMDLEACYLAQVTEDPNSCTGKRPSKSGIDEEYFETDYYCLDRVYQKTNLLRLVIWSKT